MRAGERERRVVVIEDRAGPRRSGVADGACCGESNLGVVGTRCPVVVRLVARIAVGRNRLEVVVGVALHARNCGMCASQREDRGVIEVRGTPGGRGVAKSTTGWKSRVNMIRIFRARKVLRMARIAIRRNSREVVIDVALRARNRDVSAR